MNLEHVINEALELNVIKDGDLKLPIDQVVVRNYDEVVVQETKLLMRKFLNRLIVLAKLVVLKYHFNTLMLVKPSLTIIRNSFLLQR